jgi:hypothetical protein
MEDNTRQTYRQDDEISLKFLIFKVKEFWLEIINSWKLIFIVSLVFVVGFVYKAWSAPIRYIAPLTFMVNDDEGGGNSGAATILSQFGLGGGGNGNRVNIEKMIELSKSRKIVSMVLFEKVKIGGKEDYLANHIIDEYGFHEMWKDNEVLNNYYFSHGNIEVFTDAENSVLKSLHGNFIVGSNRIVGLSSDEITGILSLVITTPKEELSITCANIFFDKLGEYYVEKTINKQLATHEMVKRRTDSLELALSSAQLGVLKFEDNNRSLGLKQYQMRRLKLDGEVQKLIGSYSESFKQLQITEFTLQNKTPFITIIDPPISPLSPRKESLTTAILTGTLIGIFLSIVFLIFRKVFRDAME